MIRNRKFYITISIILSCAFIVGSLFFKKNAEAQVSQGLPFGGQILMVDYCCDGSILLTMRFVGDTSEAGSNNLIYSPSSSVLYSLYNVFTPGPWILGTDGPIKSCSTVSSECEDTQTGNSIYMVGTNLI